MTYPECHGTKKVTHLPEGYASSRASMRCPRCKGAGQIDPFEFGIRTATVALGRDAS